METVGEVQKVWQGTYLELKAISGSLRTGQLFFKENSSGAWELLRTDENKFFLYASVVGQKPEAVEFTEKESVKFLVEAGHGNLIFLDRHFSRELISEVKVELGLWPDDLDQLYMISNSVHCCTVNQNDVTVRYDLCKTPEGLFYLVSTDNQKAPEAKRLSELEALQHVLDHRKVQPLSDSQLNHFFSTTLLVNKDANKTIL